jgi:hypothetical protein
VTASDRGPVAPGHEFRRRWLHLTDLVWLNTPSIAPAADAVAVALWRAIDRWQRGEQVIDDWEDDVEAHCLALAGAYAAELPRLGLRPIGSRLSQIVVARTAKAAEIVAQLHRRRIVAGANGDGLRVGFHAFNNEEDVAAVLAALRQSREPQQPELRRERLASAKRGAHRLANP